MNLLYKIKWRFKKIVLSIPSAFCAALFELGKHPWSYFFDYVFLSAEKRYKKSLEYIKRYFMYQTVNENFLLDFGAVRLLVSNAYVNNINNLVGLLTLYFDIVYPNVVKFPIKFLIEEGSYEQGGVKLEKGDVVLDVGANVGFFSFFALNKIGREGKVFSFEPIEEVNKIMKDSMSYYENNGEGISVEPFAIGDKNEDIVFNFSKDDLGTSSLEFASEGCVKVPVKQITIDFFVRENNVDKVSFIKMDIEGMEGKALQGDFETIKKHKPKLAICTYHHPDDPVVLKALIQKARSDYKFYQTSHKLFAW